MESLRDIIKSFEDGLTSPESIRFTNGNHHIELSFEDNGEYKDVFVYDVERITVDREVEVDEAIYEKGTSFLIEVNDETPTVYGHDLPFNQLMNHIESNFTQTDEEIVFISNFDDKWEELEEFIGGERI